MWTGADWWEVQVSIASARMRACMPSCPQHPPTGTALERLGMHPPMRHNFCAHRMGEGMLTASGQLQTVLARSDCSANTSREAGGYAQWAWEKAVITGRRWRTMVFGRPSMQGYLQSQVGVRTACRQSFLFI